MEDDFKSLRLSNGKLLCLGSITASEAASVCNEQLTVDGLGFYLFIADEKHPDRPIEVLAKFFSAAEAITLARAIGAQENDPL